MPRLPAVAVLDTAQRMQRMRFKNPEKAHARAFSKGLFRKMPKETFIGVSNALATTNDAASKIARDFRCSRNTVDAINAFCRIRKPDEAKQIRRDAQAAAPRPYARSESEISRQKAVVMGILGKHGGELLADYLIRKRMFRIERIETRFKRMVDAGIPLKGLKDKFTMSQDAFEQLALRYERSRGLTPNENALFEYLTKEHGITEKGALNYVRGRNIVFRETKAKIEYIKSIRLDPNVYGVDRLPPLYVERLLGRRLALLKRGIVKDIRPLEDAFASIFLDREFIGWRDISQIRGKKTGDKGRMRPSTLLRKLRLLAAQGKPINVYTLENFSTERIAAGQVQTPSKPDIRRKIRPKPPAERVPDKSTMGSYTPLGKNALVYDSQLSHERRKKKPLFSDAEGPAAVMEEIFRAGGNREMALGRGLRISGAIGEKQMMAVAENLETYYAGEKKAAARMQDSPYIRNLNTLADTLLAKGLNVDGVFQRLLPRANGLSKSQLLNLIRTTENRRKLKHGVPKF